MSELSMARRKARRAWLRMIRRCDDPSDKDYHLYGGRGIRIFKFWYDFETFLKAVGLPPTPDHSIDRFPNCNGHYFPGNVRWATREQQNNNKHDTVKYPFRGKNLTVAELSRALRMSYHTVNKRLKMLGWTIEDVVSTTKRNWEKKAV